MTIDWVRPRITCADGTLVSVQASKYHYCTPRTNEGPHTHYEVAMFHQFEPESWAEYHQGDGIYAYVPAQLVEDYITQHGGRLDPAPKKVTRIRTTRTTINIGGMEK